MKVVVLAGGRSSEHRISLESAKSVLDGLEDGGHETYPVVIDRGGVWRSADPREESDEGGEPAGEVLELTPGRRLLDAEVVFPVLHGPFGEDGTVQGLLECLDVPYAGTGVLGSALCIDKPVFKQLMAQAGLPQVRYEVVWESAWVSDRDSVAERIAALGSIQFVKPARLGSSVGISKVSTPDELPAALDAAFAHDACVVVEAAATGKEVECSVIGNGDPVASEPGQILARADWYDYGAKYSDGGMELVVPAPIGDAQRDRVRQIAVEAFRHGACSGFARVDFFVTDDGRVLLNELNTIPGFTSTSVFARLFEASGVSYVDLLNRLLAYAIERHGRERQYRL